MIARVEAAMIETYRGVVYPWHCDHMGHMNVMWYVGKFDEATWNLFAQVGVTAATSPVSPFVISWRKRIFLPSISRMIERIVTTSPAVSSRLY